MGGRRDHQPGAAASRRGLPAPPRPARALPPGWHQPAGSCPGQGAGDFFAARGLALPPDQATMLRAACRQRLVDAVPAPLRPGAAGFCQHLLHARDRARRAGTRPRAGKTIERRLRTVRDMAVFLTGRDKNDWATASVGDVEAFLAIRPADRPSGLRALRHFFTWARASRLVLTDPTRGLSARQPRGYHGPTAVLSLQQRLFRRWTRPPGPPSNGACATTGNSAPRTRTCWSPGKPRPPGPRPQKTTRVTSCARPGSRPGCCAAPAWPA